MGWSVVKQPDGKFAIFSSIVDDIICYDCTEEEIIEMFAWEAYDIAKKNAEMLMWQRAEDEKSGYSLRFKTWDRMCEIIKDVHGYIPDLEQLRKEHE